jgi:hypothetical protein
LLLRLLGPSVSKKLGVCRSEATPKPGPAGSDPAGDRGGPAGPAGHPAWAWDVAQRICAASPGIGLRLAPDFLPTLARAGVSSGGCAPPRARRAFGGKGRAPQRFDLRVRSVGGWPDQRPATWASHHPRAQALMRFPCAGPGPERWVVDPGLMRFRAGRGPCPSTGSWCATRHHLVEAPACFAAGPRPGGGHRTSIRQWPTILSFSPKTTA